MWFKNGVDLRATSARGIVDWRRGFDWRSPLHDDHPMSELGREAMHRRTPECCFTSSSLSTVLNAVAQGADASTPMRGSPPTAISSTYRIASDGPRYFESGMMADTRPEPRSVVSYG